LIDALPVIGGSGARGLLRPQVRMHGGIAGWLRCRAPGHVGRSRSATRELRELVRHRAKLVGLRSPCSAEVHAVLAKCGVQVLMSELFGVVGKTPLDRLDLRAPYAARSPHCAGLWMTWTRGRLGRRAGPWPDPLRTPADRVGPFPNLASGPEGPATRETLHCCRRAEPCIDGARSNYRICLGRAVVPRGEQARS